MECSGENRRAEVATRLEGAAKVSKKFVAVVNQSFEGPVVLNALGHAAVGLGAGAGTVESMGLVQYEDKNGAIFPNISAFPFIVLKGRGGQLKTFRGALLDALIPHTCFLDSMMEGGSDAQVARTMESSIADSLNVIIIVAFGERNHLDPLTKKFSVWRP